MAKATKKQMDENILVEVVNNFTGSLAYKCERTGQYFRFDSYGDKDSMTVGQLRTMLSQKPQYFKNGWIRVLDDAVIEYLNLSKYDIAIVKNEDIESLFDENLEVLKTTLESFNANSKEVVFNVARDKYVNGLLRDIHIIKAIEQILGRKLDPNEQ
jgi:hypothetical protein